MKFATQTMCAVVCAECNTNGPWAAEQDDAVALAENAGWDVPLAVAGAPGDLERQEEAYCPECRDDLPEDDVDDLDVDDDVDEDDWGND